MLISDFETILNKPNPLTPEAVESNLNTEQALLTEQELVKIESQLDDANTVAAAEE